jgi:uncharacterized tellurite resistance protein B-like protein
MVWRATLIDSIRSIFGSGEAPRADDADETQPETDPLHLAACALLLEVAYADGEFSAAERSHLENVLERHFSLPAEAGRKLLDLAEKERQHATDHFRFTSQLRQGYDTGQKMLLAEIMWGVVLADGEIAEREHYLTRKISNLLDLKPGYLSAAKAAAARKEP